MAETRLALGQEAIVGLPQALLHYELYPYWRALLESLGLKAVVSGPTSREIIEVGTREALDEACLPVKVFYGHVAALRNRVDAILLPRVVSLNRGTYTCPKMLGLPDMIRHNLRGLPPVIVVDVDETVRGRSLAEAGLSLARRLGRSASRARVAVRRALAALEAFRTGLWAGLSFEEALRDRLPGRKWPAGDRASPAGGQPLGRSGGPAGEWRSSLRVGLLGHAYNLFDSGVNLGLWRRLGSLGCTILTSEALSLDAVEEESARLPKAIFWSSGRRSLAAAARFRREGIVDGLIHVVSFGCGPDSLVGEMAERETRRESGLPYLVLTIDEHTAGAGLATRLEAFVDMLQRRRKFEPGHLTTAGRAT